MRLMFVSNALWNIMGPLISFLDKLGIGSEESKLIEKTEYLW